ncbi:hypothetical protein DSECCO2_565100 [anaerobic digester metagenome]
MAEEKPIVLEMADNLQKIREGVDELLSMGLTEDMIVTLLQQKTKVSKTNIRSVLNGMVELRDELTANRGQLEGRE